MKAIWDSQSRMKPIIYMFFFFRLISDEWNGQLETSHLP